MVDDDVVGALLADQLDVALASKLDRRLDGLVHRQVFDDGLVAVVARDHPSAGRDHVDAADFDGETLVVLDSYDPGRVPALPLPIPPGATPARVETTPVITDLLIELVLSNRGVGILPNWVATQYVPGREIETVRLTAEANGGAGTAHGGGRTAALVLRLAPGRDLRVRRGVRRADRCALR